MLKHAPSPFVPHRDLFWNSFVAAVIVRRLCRVSTKAASSVLCRLRVLEVSQVPAHSFFNLFAIAG
jgi:hypothetical protein